jgi:hypothetical protein
MTLFLRFIYLLFLIDFGEFVCYVCVCFYFIFALHHEQFEDI